MLGSGETRKLGEREGERERNKEQREQRENKGRCGGRGDVGGVGVGAVWGSDAKITINP